MTVIHRLTGYDKTTEILTVEYDIPPEDLQEARILAHIPADDAGIVGSYPLDSWAAHRFGMRINRIINSDLYDWFIEPFFEQSPVAR